LDIIDEHVFRHMSEENRQYYLYSAIVRLDQNISALCGRKEDCDKRYVKKSWVLIVALCIMFFLAGIGALNLKDAVKLVGAML
jgi:hypothetical protein